MIPGGIADKLGNRYEAKWLVRCLMDVIANKSNWLKFEGVETEYQGFEFAIGRGDITEWYQTKINSPGGNWTINALKKEGVLKAFSNRFLTDENAHCFFVSQDNAKEFRTLTEKAQTSNSIDQYIQILSKEQNYHFRQLQNEWQQPDKVMFDWLIRSHVVIIPERELDSLNESYGDLYFHDGGKCVFPNLRDILEKNFNKTLTVKSVRDVIKLEGALKFKEWAFDPNIQQRLNVETQTYLQTYIPFGVGGETIPRDQSAELLDEILRFDGPELVLLTGVAGSGKSGVVRSAIAKLREFEVPHLAFRVDQYLSCGTREELGKKLTGREESPVSTLKGTFPTTSSILFIDQVDAISEISGRNGQVKEVIFRLIDDAHNFGGVRIVVVCRTFDLDSDPRLKRLKEDNRTKQIDVPLLDWKTDVEPLLEKKGFDVSSFNEPQCQLLCLPIILAVFLEIDDPSFSFSSLSNLHEKLIEKKQRIITIERKPTWSLLQPLTAMCDWMSERQKLDAPVFVLDAFSNAVDILTSEGLITSSRGQLNFFHESFFDHIYARSFVNHDKALLNLLTETEQHLFRRTQVRQILEALRQNDFKRYLDELSVVLSSNDIRFHIKIAICQWMGTIDKPSEKEFEIISFFNKPNGNFHQFFRSAVLSTHAWFDLLYENNWIRQQIEDDNKDRAEMVLWWLSNIAGEKPIEVAKLLREWWGDNAERAERLIDWFGFVKCKIYDNDPHQLCIDLIKSNTKGLFQEQKNHRIEMLLNTWERISPEHCGDILHALFEAWFLLKPGINPFDRDELKAIDTHYLNEIAKKSPRAFLEGTTNALLKSIDMVVEGGKTGNNWYHFSRRTFSGHRFGFDKFLGIYRAALIQVAQNDPTIATNYLEKMNPYKHVCLMHLHLEAIHSNPSIFGHQLPVLVSNKIVFDAGWDGADWLSFAHACRAAFPHLSLEEKEVVEKAILDHTPEIDFGIRVLREINQKGETESFWTKKSVIGDLNRSGYEQWCILETISEELLSAVTRARLHELRRKFPKAKITQPTHMEAHFVGSPIKRAHCDKMNDNQWLSAIEHYNNDEDRQRARNFIDGGASQLARELQEATKKDPTRFSDLSLRIIDTAHKVYIESILWGLAEAENVTDESLIKAVKRAHIHSDKPFGSNIARILEKHPHIAANAEMLEILIWYALNGDANESEESDKKDTECETITINTLIQRGSSLHIAGINGARGWAWEALGSVLWSVPEAENSVWEAIYIALKKEVLISVRCCMMKALEPLFNKNKDRFSESMKQLIILPDGSPHQHDSSRLAPLVTHTGINLFPYIYHWLPELANELTTLLECADETKQLVAAWLIFCESFRNKLYIEKADKLTSASVDHRQLMAGVASETITWIEDRHRAEHLLSKFFLDEDEQVRKHAADAFRQIKANEVESYRDLAAEFLKSPAFRDSSFAVLNMLETATCNVLDLIIEAAQQIIKAIEERGDQHGKHSADFHQLKDVLKREYASSESDAEARKRILDIIDLMLAREIYGVDSIVTTHDRW